MVDTDLQAGITGVTKEAAEERELRRALAPHLQRGDDSNSDDDEHHSEPGSDTHTDPGTSSSSESDDDEPAGNGNNEKHIEAALKKAHRARWEAYGRREMQLSTVDLWEGHCLHFKPAAATNTRVLSMQIAGSGANRGKVGAAISEMAFMMTGDGSSLISLQDLSMRASKSKRLHQTVKAGPERGLSARFCV